MKSIRVLDTQFNILAEIDDYESLIFVRKWHEVGEFELRINRHKNGVDQLQKGNLIMLGADRHKVGIIKHREIELSEEGKASETWLIKGWTLQGVTKQRIIVPPAGSAYDSISDVAETIMKHYVDVCMVNPANMSRKIDLIAIASDQGRGQNISWQSRFKPLDEELAKISKATGLGWNIYLDFDFMKWVFEVYEGKDLTVGQSTNPPVIFSPDFDALRTQHYAESDLNYRNQAYIAGQGEGAKRKVVVAGQGADTVSEVTMADTDLTTGEMINMEVINGVLQHQEDPDNPGNYYREGTKINTFSTTNTDFWHWIDFILEKTDDDDFTYELKYREPGTEEWIDTPENIMTADIEVKIRTYTNDTTKTPQISRLAPKHTTKIENEAQQISGLGRHEVFIDARDVDSLSLVDRGNQKLSELDTEKLLEAQILTEGPFAYEQDWDLGDIVTIQNKDWGVTMDARIIEVKEIYEPSGFHLEAVFGNSWPTLLDKIKSEFEQMSAEVRK